MTRLPHLVGARLAGEGDFKYAFAGKSDRRIAGSYNKFAPYLQIEQPRLLFCFMREHP
jgi:hypothetical protein